MDSNIVLSYYEERTRDWRTGMLLILCISSMQSIKL